ncbi:hypothetical protein C0J52_17048 [Blattella germanica]|nr:hypothetical protein C0J52_17048 [Blattella germanica]
MSYFDCFKIITVEPVLFLYMFATFMHYGIFQDLVYEKVCITSFNETICKNLHDPNNSKCLDIVQEDSSMWILGSTVALAIPSIVTANFLGSWGDTFGRKLPLLMPSLGGIFSSFVYVWMSLYNLSGPVWPIVIASAISGLFGGFVSCIMAVMSYVSNISSQGSRTARVTVLEAMSFLGGTIGPFAGAALLSVSNHATVFGCICFCHVLLIIYVLACVPQVMGTESVNENSYCSFVHVRDTLKTCFRRRDGNKRASLICFIISSVVIMTTTAVPLAAMFNFFCIPALRSLLSKQVETSELAEITNLSNYLSVLFISGKMYAFVASVENVCMLLGSAVFNSLYPIMRTLERGLIFQFAAVLQIIPLIIMIWTFMWSDSTAYSNLNQDR